METTDKVDKFKRNEIRKLLIQCTKEQQDFFHRLYGKVEKIHDIKLDAAILICERTIKVNYKKDKEL